MEGVFETYDEEARRAERTRLESEASEAWKRIGKHFDDWVAVARAVTEAREYCLHLARLHNRRPEPVTERSQVYRDEMERYARARPWLKDLSRPERSWCYWLIESLDAVEDWRGKLGADPAHKANLTRLRKLNHPGTVQREFWRAHPHLKPGADADAAPSAPRLSPTAALKEQLAERDRRIVELKDDAQRSRDFDGGFNWEETTPQDILPVVLGNPVKALKLYALMTPEIDRLKKLVKAAEARQTKAAEEALATAKASGALLGPSRPSKRRRGAKVTARAQAVVKNALPKAGDDPSRLSAEALIAGGTKGISRAELQAAIDAAVETHGRSS